MAELTELERKVVDLVEEGYVRWKIADKLGIGETTVREVIRSLCEDYECSMKDLPEAIRKESTRGNEGREEGA